MRIRISVPDAIFTAGEIFARLHGVSRSQLYTDALSYYLTARAADLVTAQLNFIYSTGGRRIDPALLRQSVQSLSSEVW